MHMHSKGQDQSVPNDFTLIDGLALRDEFSMHSTTDVGGKR